jgi:hypothetical protein
VDEKTSQMLTRKGKLQNFGTHVPYSIPKLFNITDMKNHDGMENYLSYANILDMFENKRFPFDDPDIDTYMNI